MKSAKKHKKRTAFCYAVLIYLLGIGLLYGMLRVAQRTRQALYGGAPVMASLTQPIAENDRCYALSLGGGEWNWELTLPDHATLEAAWEAAPPCMAKWLVQIYLQTASLTETVAAYTAERMIG